jgi:hypothetical protein
LINKLENKVQIIKKETSKFQRIDNVSEMQIADKKINNPKKIVNAFNKYFVTMAGNLITVKLLDKCKNKMNQK